MKKRITTEYIIAIITTILGVLIGWLANLDNLRDTLLIIFGVIIIIIFLFNIYWNNKETSNISESLTVINDTIQGKNCIYYDKKDDYYLAATELVKEAKYEILTFNDYFTSKNPLLGTNTPSSYYRALEKKIYDERNNVNFKHSTIYHLFQITKSNLSENLTNHLKKLLEVSNNIKGNLTPLIVTNTRYQIYMSFTIIDKAYLRITFHGISNEIANQPNASGGLIFYENNNGIINKLYNWFSFIERNSKELNIEALIRE